MDESDLLFLREQGYAYDRTLYSSDKSHVGLFHFIHDPSQRFAIKRREGCQSCLDYEYEVGSAISQRSSRLGPEFSIIGRTDGDLFDDATGYQYLVTEYLPGVNLSDVFNKLNDRPYDVEFKISILRRFVRMLRVLYDFEKITGFTHYDLHFGNIVTDDDLRTFKLIDFGLSHYPGITGWIETSDTALVIGVVPSVNDLWFDLVRLIVLFYRRIGRPMPTGIRNLLSQAGFIPEAREIVVSEDFDEIDLLIQAALTYPGAEIIADIDLVERVPESMWDPEAGGFWVGDGDIVDCTRPDISNFQTANFIPGDQSSKILFGDLMTCLKKRAKAVRPIKDPIFLLQDFERDIEQWIASLSSAPVQVPVQVPVSTSARTPDWWATLTPDVLDISDLSSVLSEETRPSLIYSGPVPPTYVGPSSGIGGYSPGIFDV